MFALFKKALQTESAEGPRSVSWVPWVIRIAAAVAVIGAAVMLVQGALSFNKKAIGQGLVSHEEGRKAMEALFDALGAEQLAGFYGGERESYPVSVRGIADAWLWQRAEGDSRKGRFRLATDEELSRAPNRHLEGAVGLPLLHLDNRQAPPGEIRLELSWNRYWQGENGLIRDASPSDPVPLRAELKRRSGLWEVALNPKVAAGAAPVGESGVEPESQDEGESHSQ